MVEKINYDFDEKLAQIREKIREKKQNMTAEEKNKMLEEEKRERLNNLYLKKLDVFNSLTQHNFIFASADEKTDTVVLEKIKKYTEKFRKMKENNIGLFIYGNVGVGKTYLASCIANELLEKDKEISIKMLNFSEILNSIQASDNKSEYINDLTNVDLLIIDDFGIERTTEFAQEQMYNVINSRSLKKLPLIITSNISFTKLKYSQDNEVLKRINSRIIEMCLPLKIKGDDRRLEINKQKTAYMLSVLEED